MKTSIHVDHRPGDDGHLVRVLLEIHGTAPSDGDRPAVNISLVLDRSGSMAGEKLAATKRAARGLIRRLHPDDVVSVIAYDDEVMTIAEPASGSAQDGLGTQINRIESGGMTNLSAGWLRGRELVDEADSDLNVRRILLMTDGLANRGIVDPEELKAMCAQAAAQGITTSTIGFGATFNEELLRGMADAGSGNTYYIEQVDQANPIFATEIEGLLSLSAQNVAVDVDLANGVKLAAIRHRYPTAKRPDGAIRLEMGDLYAREPKRLLAEFLVAADPTGGQVDVARFAVQADVRLDAGGMEHRRDEFPVSASPAGAKVDPTIERQSLLLLAAEARSSARDAAAEGQPADAADVLREAADRIDASSFDDDELVEESQDLRAMSTRMERDTFTASDSKYLYQRSYATQSSRVASSRSIYRDWDEEAIGDPGGDDGAEDDTAGEDASEAEAER